MGTVAALYDRLEHPNWMPNPRAWQWRRPDGTAQGFAPLWPHEAGLANLLWLSMDMYTPPAVYDTRLNTLYGLLILHSPLALLDGELLTDWAGVLPLREFHAKLPSTSTSAGIERTYPLLRMLAGRRIEHAHP